MRPPVFLSRRPDEPPDQHLAAWYQRLLKTVSDLDVRGGNWRQLETTGWPDNHTSDNLLAWCWGDSDAQHLVVVNFSAHPAQGRIHLAPEGKSHAEGLRFADLLTGCVYFRDGTEVADIGLSVDLHAWETYVFAVDRVPVQHEAMSGPRRLPASDRTPETEP